MEIDEGNCKCFENRRKVISCGLLPYNFSSRNKTNKQNNLLTLTVSCEKSCLTRRKKTVKNKWMNNNNNKNEIKRKDKRKRD